MTRAIFGHLPDGAAVERVTIAGGGLTARVLSYGSVLQDLRLAGHGPSLVLGLPTLADYLAHSRYFGATAGRCANRIGQAAFTLDGTRHQVDPNFLGKHHLHGGSASIGKRLWRITDLGADQVTLAIDLADGEMGYPGAMTITHRIALLPGGVLDIRLTATTDRATLCNLAHHSYFNLSGGADVLDHRLRVAADHYLPVDAELIPTGQVAPVAGTAFDLRAGPALGTVCAAQKIDHNFCLSAARTALREVASLQAGDLTMAIRTTEPGLQVYDGALLDVPVPGLDGARIGPHGGIALEPQIWPDAINHPGWPDPVLRPGQTYDQHTQFVFTKGGAA